MSKVHGYKMYPLDTNEIDKSHLNEKSEILSTNIPYAKGPEMAIISRDIVQLERNRSNKNASNAKNNLNLSIADNVLDEKNMMSVVNFGSSVKMTSAGVIDSFVNRQNNTNISEVSNVLKSVFERSKNLKIKEIPKNDSFFSKIFTGVKNRQEIINDFRDNYQKINRDVERLTESAEELSHSIIASSTELQGLIDCNKACIEQIAIYRKIVQEKRDSLVATEESQAEFEMFIDRLDKKLIDFDTLNISIHQTNKQIEMIVTNNYDVIEKIQNINGMMLPLWRRQFAMVNTLIEQNSLTTISKDHVDLFDKNQKDLNNLMIGIIKGN